MARRYTRDNRGRFSSTGATARGGRLRTAAGNKRATQTTKISGSKASGTVAKPKGLKPGAIKVKSQVSSARQAATDRLKVKTQARRAMRADRASVVTPGQRSRLEAGKGTTMKSARPTSTVARPRTVGNTQEQVASRVQRKTAANKENLAVITRSQRTGATQGRQYERALKRQATLERAQNFLKTGQLPGRDNSISAQRNLRQAKARLAAKNSARQRGDTASVNIPMRGARGRALDRDISNAVKQTQAAKMAALMKPKAQVRAERAARAESNRAAQAAKPKRTRTPESLRVSRAKRVLKEREMKTTGTLRQWEQSKRTQERALAFYKSKGKRK